MQSQFKQVLTDAELVAIKIETSSDFPNQGMQGYSSQFEDFPQHFLATDLCLHYFTQSITNYIALLHFVE